MYALLLIGCTFVGMVAPACTTSRREHQYPFFTILKCFCFGDIGFFGIPLFELLFDVAVFIGFFNDTRFSTGDFRYIIFSEVIDEHIQRTFRYAYVVYFCKEIIAHTYRLLIQYRVSV